MTNEEIQSIIARAEDEYELLKDRCHDYYKKNKQLEQRIGKAIEWLNFDNMNEWFECPKKEMKELLNILQGSDKE